MNSSYLNSATEPVIAVYAKYMTIHIGYLYLATKEVSISYQANWNSGPDTSI